MIIKLCNIIFLFPCIRYIHIQPFLSYVYFFFIDRGNMIILNNKISRRIYKNSLYICKVTCFKKKLVFRLYSS